VLSVVEQRGRWLGVLTPELDNGVVGWLPARRAELGSVPWAIPIDLSKRALLARKDGRTLRRFTVAIGRRSNPTPTGRFAVTDRFAVVDRDSPYGCRVLALTGHQRKLPLARWRPAGDPRHQRHRQHRQGRQPRLHAGGLVSGTLADRDGAAGHAGLHQELNLTGGMGGAF